MTSHDETRKCFEVMKDNNAMKKIIKACCTLAMASTLILGSTISASAAVHSPGCGATGKTQVCGSYRTSQEDNIGYTQMSIVKGSHISMIIIINVPDVG